MDPQFIILLESTPNNFIFDPQGRYGPYLRTTIITGGNLDPQLIFSPQYFSLGSLCNVCSLIGLKIPFFYTDIKKILFNRINIQIIRTFFKGILIQSFLSIIQHLITLHWKNLIEEVVNFFARICFIIIWKIFS